MMINGVFCEGVEKMTLAAFIEDRGYDRARVACELNGAIVSRSRYDTCMLADVDRLEIVHFVGGG
ncbi:MAG: sulfur carrier protein ThiS [Raoultibacter sp.]